MHSPYLGILNYICITLLHSLIHNMIYQCHWNSIRSEPTLRLSAAFICLSVSMAGVTGRGSCF